MMKSTLNTSLEPLNTEVHTLRMSVVIFVIMLLITVASFVVRLQSDQNFMNTMIPAIVMLTSLVSIFLIRNGRFELGNIILISSLWMGAYGTTMLTEGIGLWLSVSVFLVTVVIVSQTMLNKLTRGVIINAVSAVILVLLDLYWPYARSSLPLAVVTIIPLIFTIASLLPIYFAIQQFPNYSLLVKLFITNVLVILGAIIGVVYFIGISTGKTVTTSAGNALYGTADVQALSIGSLLAQQINLLEAYSFNTAFQSELEAYGERYIEGDASTLISEADDAWQSAEFTDPFVQQVLNNKLAQELEQFRNKFRTYSEMLIVDQYGALVASTFRPSHYDQGEDIWWQTVREGNVYISEPHVDAARRVINIDIAIPIHTSDSSNIIGALHATYSLRDLRSALLTAETSLGDTGKLGLLLPENQFLDASSFSTVDLSPETMELFSEVENKLYARVNFTDTPRLVSQVELRTIDNQPIISDLGWVVVAQQELQASLRPVAEQQRGLIVLGVTALAISSILVAVFGRILIRPITDLIEAAKAVSAGNLDMRATVTTRDEIGKLAVTFNGMADEIQQTMAVLEDRVTKRTTALEMAIKISRDISTILDQQALVTEVVAVTQQTFGYYHVHVYLIDDNSNELVMVGGTGDAGLSMMSKGHKMPMGVGIVGRAAINNEIVLVTDTLQDDEWQPNPLLPDTRSELAMPISFNEDEVFGVLDVQQSEVDGLDQGDVRLLQSVANQTAVALRNIRLYQVMQAQAEREATANLIGQKIQAAVDVNSVLRIAARELGESLGAQQAMVQISR